MSRHPVGEMAALVDGELDHVARERTLGHLTHCASCRTEVDAQRRIKARLLGLDGQPPSQELSDRLLALGGSLERPDPELPGPELPDPELGDPELGDYVSGRPVATRHAAGPEQESPADAGPALTGPAGPLFGSSMPAAGGRRPGGAWRPGAASGGSPGPGRRPRRWQRRTMVSGAFLAIGLGAVLAVGGPRGTPGRTAVDPASDTFVVDYATTSVELPLPDPAGVSTVGFGK